jgi:hypothetical protein
MEKELDQWALIDLMGHVQTAGRISRPGDWGGLLRVDVPIDGTFRTEYYGMAAIYSIKLVSEEIALAYATKQPDAIEYDAPIVTRNQYVRLQEQTEARIFILNNNIRELQRRLTTVNGLPELSNEGKDNDEPTE